LKGLVAGRKQLEREFRRIHHVFLDRAKLHGTYDTVPVPVRETFRKIELKPDTADHFPSIVPVTQHLHAQSLSGQLARLAEPQGIDPGAGSDGGQKQAERLWRRRLAPAFQGLIGLDQELANPGIHPFSPGKFDFYDLCSHD